MKRFLIPALLGTLSVSVAQAKVENGKSYGDWKGICENDICAVVQTVSNKENTPVGRVIIRKVAEAKNQPVMFITVPLGVNLHAGMGVAIDGKELKKTGFDFCDPSGCNVALPLTDDVQNKIKAGNKLQVAAFVADKQQTLEFSLKGSTNALKAL